MLKIINNINLLEPFFNDCYSEIGVREYSRLMKISPPTASKILKNFFKENFLIMTNYRNNLLFRVNYESQLLRDLSRIYWKNKLSRFINFCSENFSNPAIILFGSLSKLESKKDSDIDIAIISKTKKDLNLEKFEKELNREIQIFFFSSFDKINKELKSNIINGFILYGEIENGLE